MTDLHLKLRRRPAQAQAARTYQFLYNWLALATCVCALLIATFSSLAEAQRPQLPSPIPGGYVIVADGDVTWLYPESTESEVTELRKTLPGVTAGLRKSFGETSDGPLDIRIALHAQGMAKLAPGHQVPDYAQGVAYPAEGLILLTFATPFTFDRPNMQQVLTHEVSHVALHRAVGGRQIPRWFTEGVAIDQAGEQSLTRLRTLWEGALRKQLLPIAKLDKAFPRNHHAVNLAYAQSASLVRHLRDNIDDATRFAAVLGSVRAGRPFESAIQDGYGVSLQYIEREWRSSLLRNLGRWPSLLTGLTALWALIAAMLLVGYFRARRKHHRTLAAWQLREAAEAQTMEQPDDLNELRTNSVVASPPEPSVDQTESRPHRVDDILDRVRTKRAVARDLPSIEHHGERHTLH